MNTNDDKAAVRQHYRQLRSQKKNNESFTDVLDLPEIQNAKTIASYFSYGNEPETIWINGQLILSGKNLLLPFRSGDEIQWREWDGDQESIEVNNGISESTGRQFSNIGAIDALIVPALAIDKSGNRLGKGKGFYDRALATMNAFSVALIYSDEFSEKLLPRDAHDMAVNAALTPEKLYRFS